MRAHAPDGALPNLSIDIATLGDPATADGIIIHTSGVHGVEGYTGSAIQIAFLRRAADTKPNPKVALVLVHAVNALGMAEFRRWNERGVDLNRNYIGVREGAVIEGTDQPATFANLAALPYDLYKKVSSAINIEAPSILPRVEFYSSIVPALLRYGFGSLKQAIAGGNYLPSAAEKVKASRQPEVFYGGFEMEQSVRLLHDLLERLGRKRTRAMPRAFHIDVHTGLGSYGHDSLLATDTRGEAGHVTSLEALSAALGGDGTAEGAERVRGEGYHVEIEETLRVAALLIRRMVWSRMASSSRSPMRSQEASVKVDVWYKSLAREATLPSSRRFALRRPSSVTPRAGESPRLPRRILCARRCARPSTLMTRCGGRRSLRVGLKSSSRPSGGPASRSL